RAAWRARVSRSRTVARTHWMPRTTCSTRIIAAVTTRPRGASRPPCFGRWWHAPASSPASRRAGADRTRTEDVFDHKEYIAALPRRPGVYRMYGPQQELLYVGKARSLKDRVGHYFLASNVDPKVQAL